MTYKKRQLSHFMGQEMIYDYLSDNIEKFRKESFEEYLKSNDEFQDEVNSVQQVMSYLDDLSKTEVAEPILTEITQKTSFWGWVGNKLQWGKRSNPIKWAIEATFISIVVAGVGVLIPWDRVFQNTESNNLILLEKNVNEEPKAEESDEKLESIDDTIATQVAAINKEKVAKETKKASPMIKPKKKIEKPKEVKVSTKKVAPVVPPVKKKVEKKVEEKTVAKHGFLYRLNIKVNQVDDITNAVRSKILEFGGKKAGKVRLGWKKSDGSSYFHFILPKDKLDNFTLFIRRYGRANLKKLVHPRIMKDKEVRLILLVKPEVKKVAPPADEKVLKQEKVENEIVDSEENANPAEEASNPEVGAELNKESDTSNQPQE